MLLAFLSVLTSLVTGEGEASSRYYCSTPTVTLEVRALTAFFAPVRLPESEDTASKPDSSDTVISDDNDNPDHKDNTVSEDHEADQQTEQQSDDGDGNTGDGTEIDETVTIHHNALIISRLIPENHSLHTEINVDNITSSDQVFIDVFSGDQEAAATADSLFISFENEEGVVKTIRIGLDEQIDNITVLDGISGETSQQTASSSDEFHHIDSFLGLEQIESPIVIILSDTEERIYFSNGATLRNHVFQEQYRIESVRAVRDEIEIRLIKK